MITLGQVNKALAAKGYPDQLCQGNGYLYFWGPDATAWYTSSVSVCKLNHIPTVTEWVARYERLRAEYHPEVERQRSRRGKRVKL